jgi:hypothetical protein
MSFLEKFNGKMSKMGKQGITGLLNGSEPYVSAPQAATASEATKRPSSKAILTKSIETSR